MLVELAALARLKASPSSAGFDAVDQCTHRRGVGGEVDSEGFRHGRAIGNQVVEALLAHIVLQLVDDGKAAIVEHQDDQLLSLSTEE
jgi:hypothetical protein